jgi:SNF2 family DNA or RNA helicase
MKGTWIIDKNHLAIECENKILHPNADDVFSIITNGQDSNVIGEIVCNKPSIDLPQIRFSMLGSNIHAEISNGDNGSIDFKVDTIRRGISVSVDIVEGKIIDQCVNDNTWFFISGNIGDLQDVIDKAGIKENGKISFNQYLKVFESEIFVGNVGIETNLDVNKLRSPIDNNEDAPKELKATLFPYQKDGYLWLKHMLNESKGCILGDEMGLGKTMQIIAVLLNLQRHGLNPSIVIAPISLLSNWKRECAKFAPSLRVHIHHGYERISNYKEFFQYDVVVTSYTTVVSDIHMLNMVNWQLVVLDEAQNIKNPYSARTKACKQIKRKKSVAVTGTPFENHISDIWSLIDFVQPGLLGSIQTFKTNVTDDVIGGEKMEPILTPLMIRRLVADVAKDLPEKIVSSQPILMSEEESLLYNKYREEVKSIANADNINLGMLQKLRMFCTHPYVVNPPSGIFDPAEVSIKYQRFIEILEEIIKNREKTLVFTSYKKMFEIFEKDLPNRFGVQIWCINGETPVEERQVIVDKFNSLQKPAVLILNPRAAGTGLNITGANHVIHYNLEWNPSLEDQSSARAYRRGQEKTVFIYRLYYSDTIEQIVNERIERKRDVAGTAVVGNIGDTDRQYLLSALELIPTIRTK